MNLFKVTQFSKWKSRVLNNNGLMANSVLFAMNLFCCLPTLKHVSVSHEIKGISLQFFGRARSFLLSKPERAWLISTSFPPSNSETVIDHFLSISWRGPGVPSDSETRLFGVRDRGVGGPNHWARDGPTLGMFYTHTRPVSYSD